ncbi:hypothetical protein [Williamsia sp. 1135]|uniref:hypothetical protein n=1 Tax=Williamsia sp. 1135 TaxID=1889262 RepID=UPI001180A34E|nr:hypothetical protein [Williamsia sp. 1135]
MSASLCGTSVRTAAAEAAVPTARNAATARLSVMVIVPPPGRTHPVSPVSASDDAQTEAR